MSAKRDAYDNLFPLKKPLVEGDEDGPEVKDIGPCASRVRVQPWPGLHIKDATLIPDGTLVTRSIDYSHMGYREYDASNTFFIIEINEPEKWKIRVEGRALWNIYNYIHQHRLEWIRRVVGNQAMGIKDGVGVIHRITIQRIEDKKEPEGDRGVADSPERHADRSRNLPGRGD